MIATAENIPEPKFIGQEKDPDSGDIYYVYEDVPVFDEHDDGEGVEYDKHLLECIAANNNQRIADTGDYCPIVEHHTPDDDDPDKDPEVFGYAGPFNVQKFGKVKTRWAIYAKRWKIKAEKLSAAKKRPRRSVEIWPEGSPEQRYFDPIALLGAETPRRDLGLIKYKKNGHAVHYMASGTSTWVPDTEAIKNKKDEAMETLSPESITQIIQALRPEMEAMIDEKMGNMASDPLAPGEVPGAEDPAIDPALDAGGPGELPMPAGGAPNGMDPEALPFNEDAPAPEAGAPLGDVPPGGDGNVTPAEEDEDDDEFGGALAKKFMKRYSKDGEFDTAGAMQYMEQMDESDRDAMDKYMKGCDDEEMTKNYAKCCGSADDGELKKQYRKADEANQAEKFRKLEHANASLRRKYSKAVSDLADMKDEVIAAKASERYSKRRAALVELNITEGIVCKPDEEMEQFNLGTVSDDQFEKHQEHMRTNYQKVPPTDVHLENMVAGEAKKFATESPNDRSAKYAKKAQKLAEGRPHLYTKILTWMAENDSDKWDESEEGKAELNGSATVAT